MSNPNGLKKLDKKDLRKSWLYWVFFNLSSMSFERLESFGFCHSMLPIIKKLYDRKEDQIAAMKRHSMFYNTEPQIGSVVNGIVAGLEEKRANGEPFDDNVINSIKVGLMGPLAGIGDSMIPGMLIPILLSIGMGLASGGSLLGPLFYIIAFNGIVLYGSYFLFMKGYQLGVDSMKTIVGEKTKRLTEAFSILGVFVMGAVASSYVKVSTGLTFVQGKVNINVQEMLDKIFPNLLPLLLVLFTWYLMAKKNVGPLKMMLVLLVVAALGVSLHVFK